MPQCNRCRRNNDNGYKICNICRDYFQYKYKNNKKIVIKPILYRKCHGCKLFHNSTTSYCSNCKLYRKNRYHRRKNMGLCPICGKFKQPGYVYCLRCRNSQNLYRNTKKIIQVKIIYKSKVVLQITI